MQQHQELLKRISNIEKLLEERKVKPLNFNQAAEYLGFSHSYLYKLTARKIIPCHRPTGKVLFFTKAELDEWIVSSEKSNVKSEAEKGRKGEEVNDEEEEPP